MFEQIEDVEDNEKFIKLINIITFYHTTRCDTSRHMCEINIGDFCKILFDYNDDYIECDSQIEMDIFPIICGKNNTALECRKINPGLDCTGIDVHTGNNFSVKNETYDLIKENICMNYEDFNKFMHHVYHTLCIIADIYLIEMAY
jgi:hypothetical protein